MQLRAPVSFFSIWEGPKMGFFPKDRTYRAFFVLLHKRNFFWMVSKGLNAFGPLCMRLRAPISFFLLFGANSSPEKVQHFLVSPNSIKIVPNGMFFGAATGSGVLLCWGRCTKISTFLRDPPHPSQNCNFHLIDKIGDFLHYKLFFLIGPRDLHYYWASAQHCAVNNTFFSLWDCPKMGFFP